MDIAGISGKSRLALQPLHKMVTFHQGAKMRHRMSVMTAGTHRGEALQVVKFWTAQRFQINVGNPPGGEP